MVPRVHKVSMEVAVRGSTECFPAFWHCQPCFTSAPGRVTWSGGSISRCFESPSRPMHTRYSKRRPPLPFQSEAAAKKAAASGQQSGTPKTKEGEITKDKYISYFNHCRQGMLTYIFPLFARNCPLSHPLFAMPLTSVRRRYDSVLAGA